MPDESYPIEESWIVMTSSEPQQMHDELIKINEALTEGNAIQFFIPLDVLMERTKFIKFLIYKNII